MRWTDESIAFLRDAAAMNRYYETVAERIAPQLPENAHICDAGCGIGELSLALKPYCHHVTAVDADELAIKTLEAHLIKGVTAICGDMETLAPEKPYDAMVFCLFGRTQDTLRIAKKQCRGRIFLVKRDYSHHRFSAGKVSLGEYTAGSTEAVLHEKGVPYTVERFTAEFGQPFRSLEAAERFFALYNRSRSETLSNCRRAFQPLLFKAFRQFFVQKGRGRSLFIPLFPSMCFPVWVTVWVKQTPLRQRSRGQASSSYFVLPFLSHN